jgi:hypothetical protein
MLFLYIDIRKLIKISYSEVYIYFLSEILKIGKVLRPAACVFFLPLQYQ